MPTSSDSCLTHRTWYTSAAAPDAKSKPARTSPPILARSVPSRTRCRGMPSPIRRPPPSPRAGRRFQLLHHLVDAEAGRLLPWWKLLEALDPLPDEELGRYEQKDPTSQPVAVVDGLALGLFEGVAAQVEEARDPEPDERLRPDFKSFRALLGEHGLPLVVAQRHQVTVVAPVEELLARVLRDVTLEVRHQIVAVEVDLERLVPRPVAGLDLVHDARLASRREDRGQHVLVGEDVVGNGAGLDDPGPADDARYAPAALPVGVLLTAERGGSTVRPGEDLGAVVGGPHDDRVVGDPEVVELLEKLPDHAVVLHHAVGVCAKTRLALRRGFQ